MGSSTDFRRSYQEAARRTRAYDAMRPAATRVEYRSAERRVYVELSNGALFAFPVDAVQGLTGASDAALAEVRITPSGHGLRWSSLDADHLLEGLMQGMFGTREWMRELGRRGGRARTERKAVAARINGLKGGRPRKRQGGPR